MKKLLLGLGTLSLVALPVLVVASCSSKTPTIIMKGSLNREAVTIGDISTAITAIDNYQDIPTPDDKQKATLITALNLKSFEGLTEADLPNFVITYDNKIADYEAITLTAKDGFTFGAGTSLVSRINTVAIPGAINSGAVTTDDMKTTIAAIKVYKAITTPDDGNKDTLIAALNLKSFQDLVKGDLTNFDIAFDEAVGSETITLTAKDGFAFETGTPLVSKINTVAIPGSLSTGEVTSENVTNLIGSIKRYQLITNPDDKQKTFFTNELNYAVFTGLVKGDLTNFVITCDETVGSESITLTAKDGFTFGAGTPLVSIIAVVMSGAINLGAVTTDDMKTTIAAIEVYQKAETTKPDSGDKNVLITALNLWTFTNLVITDVPNYVITYTKVPGSETITLTAKDGFKFSTNTPLVSTVNMVVMIGAINSGAVATAEIKATIAAIEVYQKAETTKPDSGDKNVLITALNLWTFTNLVTTDVPNYVITYTEVPGSETITLTAKDGFKFSTNTPLVSRINTVTISGAINSGAVTTDDMKTTIAAIKVYERSSGAGSDKDTLIAALNATSFTGLLVADMPNYVITYTEVPGSETITLTPKDGFKFGWWTTLVSRINIIPGAINLGAVTTDDMKTTIAAIKAYKAITKPTFDDKDTLITALNTTSFTGLLVADVDRFVITYTVTNGSETITLTSDPGFEFGTGKELTSKINAATIPGSLNRGTVTTDDMKTTIAAIKVYKAITTPDDGNKDTLIAALNTTSFTGLLAADVPNYVITYTEVPGSETITLTPKNGFTFGAGTPLVSIIAVVMRGAINLGAVTTDDMKTTIAAIKVYKAITTPDDGNKDTLIAALNLKSFQSLVKGDLTNFDIAFDEAVGSESITLTAKDGFKFSTNTPLVSRINIIPGAINSGTTTITNIKNLIGSVKIYQEIIDPTDAERTQFTNDLNLAVFTGLEKEYLDKFVITYNEVVGSESIILTAKDGFTFGAGKALVSKSGVIPGSINSGPTTITNIRNLIAAVKTYQAITDPTDAQKTNLTNDLNYKVFIGLEKEYLDKFVITYNEVVGSESITLTAKDGFTFGAGKALVSQYDEIVPYSGETLNKSDLAGIGWDSATTITLQDWKEFAPNVKQLGASINNENDFTTAPFYENAVLKSIEIPNTIEIIGSYAFAKSTIETITFQSESILKTISMDVFLGCTDFKSDFTLPDSVTHIYKEAFRRANFNGKQLIINPSSSLTTLDAGIFGEAVNIANMIHIPSSVANILSNSFIQTTNLTNGFSIEAKWRTANTAMYGFNQSQWDTKITWR